VQSCIYEGQVRHARTRPVLHRFRYRLFMMYLDLDELPSLFDGRWLWSIRRFALARFRREDHLGDPAVPLAEAVRDTVAAETGVRPVGPIRLLTNLSYFGYCFNPVSFFYCFEADGETLQAIVAEVNNTPWGERDTYVLAAGDNIGTAATWRFRPEKKMHVSPFMSMRVQYDWCFALPNDRTTVHMATHEDDVRIFDANMTMRRTEITGRSLARVLITFPLMTMRIVGGIYWQALRLWLKGTPFYPHPGKEKELAVR